MPKFRIVIHEFREYEFIEECRDEHAAREWGHDVMRKEGCDLDGYEISVREVHNLNNKT